MIRPEHLYNFLCKQDIDFYTGVPDSVLQHFLAYVQDHAPEEKHIITANEGLAIALAAGYHLGTGGIPLVYFQNSGLGNIVNPLTSLASKEMYGIPMLLMIGWRGQPRITDEPQHTMMGDITQSMLDLLDIPYYIINSNEEPAFELIAAAVTSAIEQKKPVALLVSPGLFEQYKGSFEKNNYPLVREHVIKEIIHHLEGNEIVVCTAGKIGREFYEQNQLAGGKIKACLISPGAMGHANHVALGLKLRSETKVIMLDGDGSVLMHMGSLTTIPHYAKKGFVHIIINNGSHESVGGQPTGAFRADLRGIAEGCGYSKVTCITNEDEFSGWLNSGLNQNESQLVEIRTNLESRPGLGRPGGDPAKWKEEFLSAIHQKK